MNKVLAVLILGMGFTGGIVTMSISWLFKSPIGGVTLVVTASSTVAFVILTVSALLIRRRVDENGDLS